MSWGFWGSLYIQNWLLVDGLPLRLDNSRCQLNFGLGLTRLGIANIAHVNG